MRIASKAIWYVSALLVALSPIPATSQHGLASFLIAAQYDSKPRVIRGEQIEVLCPRLLVAGKDTIPAQTIRCGEDAFLEVQT